MQANISASDLQQIIDLIDLTSLTDSETSEDIEQLCQQANTLLGPTAAICIYPRFIPIARRALARMHAESIKVATVTNFPEGEDDISIALAETKAAIAYGADEVDLVFPYKALLAGNETVGFEMVKQCKTLCESHTETSVHHPNDTTPRSGVLLKVILETGELQTSEMIRKAADIAIAAGADFLKTSTGKVKVNATLEATHILLSAIVEHNVLDRVGIKVAGGVQTPEQAFEYIALANRLCGDSWVNAQHFRLGASTLLQNILKVQ